MKVEDGFEPFELSGKTTRRRATSDWLICPGENIVHVCLSTWMLEINTELNLCPGINTELSLCPLHEKANFQCTEIGKKAWLFAKLQPGRARKRINAT